MGWSVRVVLLAVFALPITAGAGEPVVVQDRGPTRPRVVLSVDATTHRRSIQLESHATPTYPTVDVTCDGNRHGIALTRSEMAGKRVSGIYEIPEKIAKSMLGALECRLLLPDQQIDLPARLLRAAWATAPTRADAPRTTSSPTPNTSTRNTPTPNAPTPNTPTPSTPTPSPPPPIPPTPPPTAAAPADHATASGRAGVHPLDVSRCPSAQPIKGAFTGPSAEACIYHVPGGELYQKTKPEMCYATEADARQDGCRRSKR